MREKPVTYRYRSPLGRSLTPGLGRGTRVATEHTEDGTDGVDNATGPESTVDGADLSLPASLGEMLATVMTKQKLSGAELARRAGVTTKHVWALRTGRARLTHDMALKLQRATGISALGWMRVDALHRDAVARSQRWAQDRQAGWPEATAELDGWTA